MTCYVVIWRLNVGASLIGILVTTCFRGAMCARLLHLSYSKEPDDVEKTVASRSDDPRADNGGEG